MSIGKQTDKQRVREVKEQVKSIVKELDVVKGVGITKRASDYALRVYASEYSDQLEAIPKSIGGVSIEIKVTGKVTKSIK